MTRAVPEAAIALIKEFEGFRINAYDDGVGIVTGGWGHVIPNGKIGTTYTRRQCELWLAEDLQIAAKRVTGKIGGLVADDLTENQWGVLICFAFNVGVGPARGSSEWKIWGLVRARDYNAIPAQLQRFNKAGGKVLKGLVRRRAAEAALWCAGAGHNDTPSSAVTRLIDTPPSHDEKPVAQSKTFWAGATVALGGAVEGAKQVQALVAPQAEAAPLLGHLAQFVAVVIVVGGIAIMLFRYFDAKARRA